MYLACKNGVLDYSCSRVSLSSVLQDIHQLVTADLTDKTTALNLDTDCHELENSSGTLGLHKDPTRIMRNIVNPDTWEAFSSHNKDKSETEMKLSVRLREAMNQSILQVRMFTKSTSLICT